MKNSVKALGVAGVLAISGTAHALTATSTFTVTATVLKACTVSATNIAFGNYTPGGGALTGNSTISVKCTKTTPYTVALNAGAGSYALRTRGARVRAARCAGTRARERTRRGSRSKKNPTGRP